MLQKTYSRIIYHSGIRGFFESPLRGLGGKTGWLNIWMRNMLLQKF